MFDNHHFYCPSEGHGLAHDPFNAIIAPRPIGWISSKNGKGQCNLAPYSFFNAFNYKPPIIGFSSIGRKDSVQNAEETGEFCWNLVSKSLAEKMNITSASVSGDVDEFELANLEKACSRIVDVPHVADSLVIMECRTSQVIQLQSSVGASCNSWLVLGEVVGVHINATIIENGVFQTSQAQPVMRGGGAGDYFSIEESNRFEMFRPQKEK